MAHKFSAEKADKLEKQERYKSFQPEVRLPEAGMRKGQTVVDVGCGTGFYTRAASKIVGSSGTVIGLDILPEMLEAARNRGVPQNVVYNKSDESKFPIESTYANWVIVTNLFHELEEPDIFISEIQRILKNDGSVYLTDWRPQEEEGPPAEHRVDSSLVKETFQKAGFTIITDDRLGTSHYELVFKKE